MKVILLMLICVLGASSNELPSHKVSITFIGTVQSIEPLGQRELRVTPVDFDSRFAVRVHIESVTPEDGPLEGGTDRVFAVHSPAQLFGAVQEDVIGKKYRFRVAWDEVRHRFSGLTSGPIVTVANGPLPQSNSQPAKFYPNAKLQANQLNDAVLAGDYEKAADLTYQKLVQLIGGRAKYVSALKGGMNETNSEAFRIISSVADDPTQIIEVASDVYAVLPTTMKIKVAEGILVGQSSMIGVSNDRGEHWTFVDAGRASSREQLKTLFAAVADRLKIPEQKRPVLYAAP